MSPSEPLGELEQLARLVQGIDGGTAVAILDAAGRVSWCCQRFSSIWGLRVAETAKPLSDDADVGPLWDAVAAARCWRGLLRPPGGGPLAAW